MKILLSALNAKYVHSNLAVYDLQAYALKHLNHNSEIEIKIGEYTINNNLNDILKKIYLENASVVAFSCYIWNINEILTIALELKKVSPLTQIWLGGPEVSYESEKLLKKYTFIDGIMRGEGEITFTKLCNFWKMHYNFDNLSFDDQILNKAEVSLSEINGLSFRSKNNEIIKTPDVSLMSLDEIPFIYNDMEKFKNRIIYYETSRGCPFSCSYCLSSIDKKVRFRSLDLVAKELQFFLDNDVPQVKFIDRTFNCKKEHSSFIWNYITEHDNGKTNFHFEIAADLITDDDIEIFKKMRPGLIQLEIGLQTTNPCTIHEIHRKTDINKLKNVMNKINALQNIHQHLDLIAGLPYEDLASFKSSFNDALNMQPEQLQLGFLKVLKGSYMYEMTEDYKIVYQNFQPYEVMNTKWISYKDIIELKQVEEMVEIYYNSGQFSHIINYICSFFDSLYDFYNALGNYYFENNLFDIGFKREARYTTLRNFYIFYTNNIMKKSDFDIKVADSLLTFDYYLRENVKVRPTWSPELPIEKTVYNNFFKNEVTNEINLHSLYTKAEHYNSKDAAKIMHLEPIVFDAAKWLDPKAFLFNINSPLNQKNFYCLYNYNNRNPLNNNAEIYFISQL